MHAKDAWLKSLSVLPLSSSHDEKGSDWPEFLSVERVAELQFPATDQDGPTASEVKDKQGELILAMRHSVDSGQLYAEYDTTLAETEVAVLNSNGESRLVKGMGTIEIVVLPAQAVFNWLREQRLTPSEHLAAWFGSMKVQVRSLPNRDMPDLWSEKTASIRPPKEVPRRFAECDSHTSQSVKERVEALYAEQTAQLTAERCAELASKVSLTLSDWEVLTGVSQPNFGMYEISVSGVKPRANVVDDGDDEAAVLRFPCSPQNLIAFVDQADVGGKHFEVPEAFRQAAGEPANFISWHDAALDARFWMNQSWISPVEAATLLCQQNPKDANCDPSEISTDETNPGDFYLLRRAFEGVAQDQPCKRSLCDWLALVKYHSWIDEYLKAAASLQEDQAPPPSEAEAVTQKPEQAVSEEGRGDAEPGQIAGLALPTTRTHRLKPRVNQLDAVIERAKQQAIDPKDYHSVWAALVKIAESECPPPLCGYSSDDIQYKGRQYEASGIPDVFTKNALRMKMNRSER